MTTVGDVGAGHTLGRYELLIPIASGGMASVWAARIKGPRGFQKYVAIKVMLSELADDPDFEKMFLDEAQLASRIKHPNVVEIIDLGEQDGVLYQVMEWVDGEPLNLVTRDARARAGLPVPLVIRIGADAGAGLHFAHELRGADGKPIGLVHRDVSPSNVLIAYDGGVKVVDFGVAKASTNAQHTRVGQMKGKAPYMSPEQARGDQVDRRTDVFALGIVLYQLATGKHPFRGENDLSTLRAICDQKPAARVRQVVPSLPPALDDVIGKALSKDRAQRFASMADMIHALDAVLPAAERAATADLGAFMRDVLGPRGEKRRAAIRDAVRIADERSASRRGPGAAPAGAPAAVPPARPARRSKRPPPAPVESSPPSAVEAEAKTRIEPRGVRAAPPAPPPDLDLESLVTRPPADNRSVIGALVVACVLAVVVVLLLSSAR